MEETGVIVEQMIILRTYILIPSVAMIITGFILPFRDKPLGKILRIVAPTIFFAGFIFMFLFAEEAPFLRQTTISKISIPYSRTPAFHSFW